MGLRKAELPERWTRATSESYVNRKNIILRVPKGLLIDQRRGVIYNSDSANLVRMKHALLLIATPIVQSVNIAMFQGRCLHRAVKSAGAVDPAGSLAYAAKALCAPVMLGVLMGAATLGLFCPFLGRAVYAAAESPLCFRLAPCFAPLAYGGEIILPHELKTRDEQQHLLGRQALGGRW